MAERKIRPIHVKGNVAYIPLTRGYEAIIDVDDVHLVEAFNWFARVGRHTVYAARNTPCNAGPRKTQFLHRVILAAPDDREVDHIDSNGLDNRRANLRAATKAENMHNRRVDRDNTSGFKGVTWHKQASKWQAQISSGGQTIYLGRFETPEAAHAAYCEAAIRLRGKFARTE